MKIRLAKLSDLLSIADIYNKAIDSRQATGQLSHTNIDERKNWFQKHNSKQNPIFVAEIEGTIGGYAYLSFYREGRGAFQNCREISYFVEKEYHRQGIASNLYDTAVQFCLKNGINYLVTFVLAHNKPSIRFLKSKKFNLWGTLPNIATIDGQIHDHLIYGLEIIEK